MTHQQPNAAAITAMCDIILTAARQLAAIPTPEAATAADEEQTLRWARREPLLVLLTRLQRGRTLTADEATALRQHVETEMRQNEQLHAGRQTWKTKAEEIEQDRDRLSLMVDEYAAGARTLSEKLSQVQAAIDRVRALHTPVEHLGHTWCAACSVRRRTGPRTDEWVAFIPHPCPTLDSLDGAEQPAEEAL
jgi:chromosome segregation ATPase